MSPRLRLSLVPLCAALIGCGSVADSDYHGEPLAMLRGSVTVKAGLSVQAPIDVAVLWTHEDSDGDGDALTSQPVRVEGAFPASFELVLNEPPPQAVLQESGTGNAFVMGFVVAVPAGVAPVEIEDNEGTIAPVGAVTEYVLIWTRKGFSEGSPEALWFDGGAIPAGYQWMRVVSPEERLAANPSLAACEDRDFGADCPVPSDDDWDAYDACATEAQMDAGCWGPEPSRASLQLAPQGVDTVVSLELVSSAGEITWPELN